MKTQVRRSKSWLLLATMFAMMLACNMPGLGDSNALEVAPQPEATTPPEGQAGGEPSEEQNPAEEQTPEEEDQPTPESQPVEQGMTRSNPFPMETMVTTPYWDFQVLEVARGEAAWQILQTDDPDNPPPPSGKEYFLAKVKITCKHPGSGSHDLGLNDLFITGDSLTGHTDKLWDHPQPEFFYSDIYTAESLEGWIDVLVSPTEGNLMLVFDRAEFVNDDYQPREVRYVALEPGALIEAPADLAGISANEIGIEEDNPAKVGESVITDEWEISIVEARRGQAALDLVMQMNPENQPPEEGMEYVVFKVRARRIGGKHVALISHSDFKMVVPGMGRSGSDWMEDPNFKLDPAGATQHLSAYLFPGGTTEGWAVKQVPSGHTPLLVNYKYVQAGSPSSAWNERTFLLEP